MTKIKTWLTIGLTSLPMLALAQPFLPPSERPKVVGGIRDLGDILGIVTRIIGWFQAIIFIIATIMILYAAYIYITSAGSDDKLKTAKNIILYAAIGIGVALLAYAVQPIVENFLGGVRPAA